MAALLLVAPAVTLKWPLLMLVAFVAATLAAVSGFGGAAVLLPVLTIFFGVRLAIPILTVAQLIGNGSRVWFNRRELNYRVVGWFALGGVPTAVIGSFLFAHAPMSLLTRLLGGFLIAMALWRRFRPHSAPKIPLRGFAVLGAISSFLSALLGSVGPLMAPFFLFYGLVKGAYIGTEAFSTVIMHVTKLVIYRQQSVLPLAAIVSGLALGPVMILGSFAGKRIVERIPERVFVLTIEAVMLGFGLMFLIRG